MGSIKDLSTIGAACHGCRKWRTVEVPTEGLSRWENGALIQDALPDLTPDDREFLISRTCGDCFDTLFNSW